MRVLFSSDAGQFQLLCLLLPCAVSAPSAFSVPFPVPFALSRGPASKNLFLASFVKQKEKLSLLAKKKMNHMAKSLAQTVKRRWRRHWEQTRRWQQ